MLDPSRVHPSRETQETAARANPIKTVRQESISNLQYSVHANRNGELGALISQLLEEVSSLVRPLDSNPTHRGLFLPRRFLRDGLEREGFAVTLSWTLDCPFRTSIRAPAPVPVPIQILLPALRVVRGDGRMSKY